MGEPPTRAALAAAAVLAAAVAPAARAEPPDRLAELPGYEQAAVAEVLDREGLSIDPAPAGKRVRRIRVVNRDVFSERDRGFTWLNALHWTTTERTIAQEVILRPGERWDEERAEETARRLRDPDLTAFVAVVPIETPDPELVDVLVVTRDAWSLRTNSDFELQQERLTFLLLEPAENNFLGRRKRVGARFEMDQGAFTVGPLYRDPNVRGTHAVASAFAGLTFERGSEELEGSQSAVTLAYPLWSLASRWGASLAFAHDVGVERRFEGPNLDTYDAPETAKDDALPELFGLTTIDLELEGVRRLGGRVKHDLAVGYALTVQRPSVPDEVEAAADPAALAGFERDVLPRSEIISALVARYRLFFTDFLVYENVDRFDLSEDRRLGPEVELRAAAASTLLGSDDDLLRLDGTLGWHFDFGGVAFVSARATAGGRLDGDGITDGAAGLVFELAGPPLARALRPLVGASFDLLYRDRQNEPLTVGGDEGLRGFEIAAFEGQAATVVSAELRTLPVPLASLRLGAVAFWDAGHAAASAGELSLRQDVGAGLRILVPQAGSVLRFDYAVPVIGEDPGLLGRFSAGFGQAF